MRRTAVLTLAASTLVGCGSTRYVVVQTPAPATAPVIAAAPAAAAPATATSTTATSTTAPPGTVAAAGATTPGSAASTQPAAAPTAVSTPAPSATVAAPAPAAAGAATAAERTLIEAAIDGALGLDGRAFDQRTAFLDGADDLGPTYAAVNKITAGLDGHLAITGVTVAGTTATATVDIVINGSAYASGLPVELTKRGDTWLVTRAGACAILAVGSPCPDQ